MSAYRFETFESELLGERYYRYRHPSGLPIYVFPKQLTTTFAMFAVNFGAIDNAFDAAGKEKMPDGVAHFLEHKLFSNEDGTDSFERFSALGADANAYTSATRTVYLFSCTSHFEESLAELTQFVTHPYFTPETVAKEQGIIGEEIRMCRDNPYDRCYYNMLRGLYRVHPVRRDICGSVASIAKITDKTLYRAYETYYKLSNMALIVCGDVDPDTVVRVASERLPQTPSGTALPRRRHRESPKAYRALRTERGQVAKPIFSLGFKNTVIPADPVGRARRDVAMAILNEMLFSPSGELYERLFCGGLISPDFSADFVLTPGLSYVQIAGEADDPLRVRDEILKFIAETREKGLSREDFERCRRVEYAEYVKGFDSTEEIAGELLSFVLDDAELFAYADLIKETEFAFVEAVFRESFDPLSMTLSVIEPHQTERKEKDNG